MPENQTTWKSDNQGVKEAFIQTTRRGAARQLGREDLQQGGRLWGKRVLADWETKDSRPLAVKYCEGCEGGRNSQSYKRVHWKVRLEQSEWPTLFPL